MKKIISLLLVAVLCLGTMTACSSDFEWDNEFGLTYDVSSLNYTLYNPDALYDENGLLKDIVGKDYVTLPADYMSIQIPAAELEPTDEELKEYQDNLLKNYGVPTQITEGEIKDGDKVNIDYIGYVDGAAFSGGNTMGMGADVTAGSSEYVDDFLDQIIGHKPGDTFDIEVTFPDDYGDAVDTDGNPVVLSGADAVFTTTINYIHGETVYPELTDEWVKENFSEYGFETVDDVNADIKAYLAEKGVYDYVTTYARENSVYADVNSLPRVLLDDAASMMLFTQFSYANSVGATLENWLELQGFDSVEDYLNQNAATLMDEVHTVLLIQTLCEELGVTTNAEAAATILGDSYQTYVDNYGPNYTNAYLNSSTCFSQIVSSATVVE